MIKLKRGEKLYKVLKPFYWSPLDPKGKGVLMKPGQYLGLNVGGAKIREARGEVAEVKKDLDNFCVAYEKHNPKGEKAHADRKAAVAASKKKGLDALEKRDPEGFKTRKTALAKAKKEAAKKDE